MFEVVTGVLKLTFGLILNKARTYGAEKLQDGGLTDQKFRSLIVRDLDDIKFKLDSLSRKDLSTSVSCLQQGVERLQMSFGESSGSKNSSTAEVQKNGKESQDTTTAGASTSTQTKPDQTSDAVEDALALANAIGKMKIESNEVFELAKESFKNAAEKAREAFHNAALSTDERILAAKVRIASGILEHLERPDVAASDCLQCLRELHDLPAIQDIFSVHIQTGIKSRIKSAFNNDSRIEIVESVTMMNLILADFITKFTKRRMGVFDWPVIKCGKRVVHRIHYNKDSLPNLKEMVITPPWDMVKTVVADVRSRCAFNKKGDLICYSDDERGLEKLDTTTGILQPYCLSPSQNKHSKIVRGLAVDDDDTVYVVSINEDADYTLSVYNADGRNTHHSTLEFLNGNTPSYWQMKVTATNDKNIAICTVPFPLILKNVIKVWLCDSSGELKSSFIKDFGEDHRFLSVFVSCNNEIILVAMKLWNDLYTLHVYTEDGRLQRTAAFRSRDGRNYRSICYNKVTKNICCIRCIGWSMIWLDFFSDQTGEHLCSYLLYKTNLPIFLYHLEILCHTNGTLALVGNGRVLFLKTSSVRT